jgi:aryl-alcohol dehydrogenase-like predicted oxidoreductase
MEYRSLGRTGVQVSVWCLGAMNFGAKTEPEEATRMIDRFLDQGGNFLDTANLYGRGESETIVGNALKTGGKRDRVFLATKFHARMDDADPNARGSSRFHIVKACEDSLRRLQTDHIDLYQIHSPETSVPIDETLRTLDDLIHQGKVRYIGTSNHAAWQVVEGLWVSDRYCLNRFVCEQPPYNLFDRRMERELLPAARSYGLGILPWSPLAGGRLTGKYRRGELAPANSRQDPSQFTEPMWCMLEGLEALCRDKGCTMAAFANAWCAAQDGVTSPIIGPSSMAQLDESLAASALTITPEDKERVDALSRPGEYIQGMNYYGWQDFGPNARWWPAVRELCQALPDLKSG